MNKYAFLLISVFIFTASLVFAQPLPVERINTTDGLSNNAIYYVFQDSYGLLWIGTENGLNLYDGYEFKVFKNDPENTESINSSVIWWIVEDAEKNLWISTGEGVSKYIRAENKFKNYDFYGNYFGSIAIYIDSKKNIWATVEQKNILKYNKTDDTWDEQKFVVDSSKTIRSPAHVTKVMEDINGKLWIASIRYGLMWYDENEKVLKQSEIIHDDKIDDFTFRDNFITDLYSDSTGVLWITSRKGIHKYNPAQKRFRTIERYASDGQNLNDDYNSITQDRFGNIWIMNNFNGLLKFEGISDNFSRIELSGQKYTDDGKSDLVLSRSLWDKSGILWIGTMTEGLIKYNPNKKMFSHYFHVENNNKSISNSKIFSLVESKVYPGNIYVGTAGGGLNIFNTKTNIFSRIPFDSYKDYYGGSVRSILEEDDGSLWLGTWGDGLLKMDAKRQVVQRFIIDSTKNEGISGDRIRVIRQDPSGNLWIGTNIGGLNYFDIKTNKFDQLSRANSIYQIKLLDLIKSKINNNKEKIKIVQVGDNENLSVEFDVNDKGKYLIVAVGEGDDNPYPSMWDYGWIEDDKNDTIWSSSSYESTYHIGGALKNRILIDVLEIPSGKYSLRYISDDSHSYVNWNDTQPIETEFWGIRVIKIDSEEELDLINDFLTHRKDKLYINGTNIKDIHLSKNNIVWVGTTNHGLHKIDKNKNNVKTYLLDNKNNNSLSDININNIYEDNKGFLWLATNRGLIEFDPIRETFKTFTEIDGLPENHIYSILPGDKKALWLSTRNGLSKMIDINSEKPTFVNHGLENGLGVNAFTPLVALKTNEKYFFGGDKGLIEFTSEKSIRIPPKLIFLDLKISNVSVLKMDEEIFTETSLMKLENLSLNHTQNDLSFEFAALHFSDPKKNNYAHQLEGYEDNWIYDNSRIATYTNLDPGEYTFKFKGSNSEGIWNETGKSISIIIYPPWWKTWWAYIGYGLIFFSIIFGMNRSQKRKLLAKAKERMKIQEAEHRAETAELQAKAAEAQSRVIQAENERKTKELEEARELQLSMLPKELPQVNNLNIAVYMKTATEVGGDYYDFSYKNDNSINICLGDATGHGMKAGTLVSMMKSIFTVDSSKLEIGDFFYSANHGLKKMSLDKMMMAFAMMNISDKKIKISNAGIPPVFIYRKNKNEVEEIKLNGLPLGAMLNAEYTVYQSELAVGDTILLLSDGMPELINENNELFGYDRIADLFMNNATKAPEQIIEIFKEKGTHWVNDKDPDDDVTFVVIKVE